MSNEESISYVFSALDGIRKLTPPLKKRLAELLKMQIVPANHYLLRSGDVCDSLYFIITGMIRIFRNEKAAKSDKQVEIVNWFLAKGDLAISVASYFEQIKSTEFIQAMEDTVLITINKAELDRLYLEFPEFNYHRSVLLEKYYVAAAKQIAILNKRSALERYQLFLHHFPHLMTIWKDEYIAAFLGMETTYFSKVKAAFAKGHR
jgi:CRP-like cAMP-binding protein